MKLLGFGSVRGATMWFSSFVRARVLATYTKFLLKACHSLPAFTIIITKE